MLLGGDARSRTWVAGVRIQHTGPLYYIPVVGYSRGDSNLHLRFRRPVSYPLDDKSVSQLHCKGRMPISHYEISASLAENGSGTCSSVSLCLRSAPPQTARPATSIATLRWETVPEQVRHRLPDAPRSIGPRPDARAHIRKSGQETVAGQASHRLLLVSHPWPLKGKIIAREMSYRRERLCPESAAIT